jgi:putative endonuclease
MSNNFLNFECSRLLSVPIQKNRHNSIKSMVEMARSQTIGRWGEDVAARFLQAKGYEILQRNVRTAYGELDIIARWGGTIVFVEVKTRTSSSFGLPEISVGTRKIRHLLDSAQAFMQVYTGLEEEWRVDVIAIQGHPGDNNPQIEVFENAIS